MRTLVIAFLKRVLVEKRELWFEDLA